MECEIIPAGALDCGGTITRIMSPTSDLVVKEKIVCPVLLNFPEAMLLQCSPGVSGQAFPYHEEVSMTNAPSTLNVFRR